MIFRGLLALLDDVALVLDDVASMVKISAKKTGGLVTDDLVVTAEQVASITTKQEIPIIWRVAKGSLLNKALLVPAALALNYFLPFLITPLLMMGGAYLCYEAVHKILHALFHKKETAEDSAPQSLDTGNLSAEDIKARQEKKIKEAILTDFVLSAEIVIIALSVIGNAEFVVQLLTLIVISILLTIVVYGSAAALVKMDDLGFYMMDKARAKGQDANSFLYRMGQHTLKMAGVMMHVLGVIGTGAMLLVGGGIVLHAIPVLEHIAHKIDAMNIFLLPSLFAMVAGVVYGLIVFLVAQIGRYALKMLPVKVK